MEKTNGDPQTLRLYLRLWFDALRARERGDEEKEDLLLEKLDTIWFSMTTDQVSFINRLSEKLVNHQLTLDQLENKYSRHGRISSKYLSGTSFIGIENEQVQEYNIGRIKIHALYSKSGGVFLPFPCLFSISSKKFLKYSFLSFLNKRFTIKINPD